MTVWAPPDTGWNHAEVWAPELARVDGRWYIYYAAAHRPGQPFVDQRSGVLRARTDDPYSTRDSWLPTYELGMLRYRGNGADPADSASWVKSAGPVFASGDGVIGTGHNTFTTSPDGRQDWLVYHAKVGTEAGWNRDIHMQPYTWRADGTPDFGAPVPNGAAVAASSGECG